jgi:hypothetical protein
VMPRKRRFRKNQERIFAYNGKRIFMNQKSLSGSMSM